MCVCIFTSHIYIEFLYFLPLAAVFHFTLGYFLSHDKRRLTLDSDKRKPQKRNFSRG